MWRRQGGKPPGRAPQSPSGPPKSSQKPQSHLRAPKPPQSPQSHLRAAPPSPRPARTCPASAPLSPRPPRSLSNLTSRRSLASPGPYARSHWSAPNGQPVGGTQLVDPGVYWSPRELCLVFIGCGEARGRGLDGRGGGEGLPRSALRWRRPEGAEGAAGRSGSRQRVPRCRNA